MKWTIFAAALMLGGAAYAQTTTDAGAMAGQAGTTVAPGNSAPERDARGIPVVSDAATAPAGWNSMPAAGGTGASPSEPAPQQGADASLPPCSKKVTDHCVQTYERGRAPK